MRHVDLVELLPGLLVFCVTFEWWLSALVLAASILFGEARLRRWRRGRRECIPYAPSRLRRLVQRALPVLGVIVAVRVLFVE